MNGGRSSDIAEIRSLLETVERCAVRIGCDVGTEIATLRGRLDAAAPAGVDGGVDDFPDAVLELQLLVSRLRAIARKGVEADERDASSRRARLAEAIDVERSLFRVSDRSWALMAFEGVGTGAEPR